MLISGNFKLIKFENLEKCFYLRFENVANGSDKIEISRLTSAPKIE